ncbi:cation/H(+) antiporter 2-like [Euphorbia lathyris]|uniref:cation/H(+) antiporter 2-like n=1 Tax=Euphorbia lathyris TaxID=212925 RepID=UPI003313ACE9
MNAAKRAMCVDDPFNPLITTTCQIAGILVISHFFHLILKPLGQPGPVAQILAGIVLGPSLLSHITIVRNFFLQSSSADYYDLFTSIFGILFMFLFGLQTDIPYMRRHLRKASIIAYGGMAVCALLGTIVAVFLIIILKFASRLTLITVIIIILSNASAPAVIRLAAELKFSTSDTGRLAISCSLINEMTCMIWFSIFVAFTSGKSFGLSILFFVLTVGLIVLNKYMASWCNQRNRHQKYVTNTEMLVILSLVIGLSFLIEEYGFNSAIACYTIGLLYPREGKTTRTLMIKLSYAVHNFILPIYFGYIGFQFNVVYLNSYRNIVAVILMVILSIGGKFIGTLLACHYLNVPIVDSVVLCFLLNLKGHAELLLVGVLRSDIFELWWDQSLHNLVVIVVIINTVISGPVVAFLLQKHEKYFAQKHTSLEFQAPDSDLRLLTCVYSSRHISSKIGLIVALSGSPKNSTSPYLMHLVELPKRNLKKRLMYHQLKDGDQFSDEEDYGGNDVVEINDAVDSFTVEKKMMIRQSKVVSSFPTMYEDVCNCIEDLRVSIVFLTFHKHQRLDGKLEAGKVGIRLTNQKVLRHAPCSVGIFVDRGQTGFQLPGADSIQDVAALFFGGPDDREALSCSTRLVSYPHTKLTLIRFLPAAPIQTDEIIDKASLDNGQVLMEISNHDIEAETDRAFLEDFHNRHIASGKVTYEETYVADGKETTEALKGLGKKFSLLIVGKGGRGHLTVTTGLSDWEECPELGVVGDLLASSECDIDASVLVIQQHDNQSENEFRDISGFSRYFGISGCSVSFFLAIPKTLVDAIGVTRLVDERNQLQKRPSDSNLAQPSPTAPKTSSNVAPGILGPPPVPRGNPSLNPLVVRRITNQEAKEHREKGLCYYCDEKFVPGHRCKRPQLFMIEDCNQLNNVKDDPIEAESEYQEFLPEISFHAISGASHPRTICVLGKFRNKYVTVLIDGGSTHYFIDQGFITKYGLPVLQDKKFKVTIANGDQIECLGLCQALTIHIQDKLITADYYVLPVAACQVVLGVQWLQTIGLVEMDYQQLTMSFKIGGEAHTFQGLKQDTLEALSNKESHYIQGTSFFFQISLSPSNHPSNSLPHELS